jgi:hypothetical protein
MDWPWAMMIVLAGNVVLFGVLLAMAFAIHALRTRRRED